MHLTSPANSRCYALQIKQSTLWDLLLSTLYFGIAYLVLAWVGGRPGDRAPLL